MCQNMLFKDKMKHIFILSTISSSMYAVKSTFEHVVKEGVVYSLLGRRLRFFARKL